MLTIPILPLSPEHKDLLILILGLVAVSGLIVIVVQDLNVGVEIALGGALTLRFTPLPSLAPHQREELAFKIFNRNFELRQIAPDTVIPHLWGVPLEVRLTCTNLQNIKFLCTFQKDQSSNNFYSKEVITLN